MPRAEPIDDWECVCVPPDVMDVVSPYTPDNVLLTRDRPCTRTGSAGAFNRECCCRSTVLASIVARALALACALPVTVTVAPGANCTLLLAAACRVGNDDAPTNRILSVTSVVGTTAALAGTTACAIVASPAKRSCMRVLTSAI